MHDSLVRDGAARDGVAYGGVGRGGPVPLFSRFASEHS